MRWRNWPAAMGGRFQSTPPVSGRRCVLSIPALVASSFMFQSTPPVSGRRCEFSVAKASGNGSFNPRPPFPGGDADSGRALEQPAGVSIHAPRFREAMQPRMCCRQHATNRFNPRPPFPGGDAEAKLDALYSKLVSIHAPRFREAMRCGMGRASVCQRFQSTPPVSGRRCDAFLGGSAIVFIVSIHAPRFREAMLDTDGR